MSANRKGVVGTASQIDQVAAKLGEISMEEAEYYRETLILAGEMSTFL